MGRPRNLMVLFPKKGSFWPESVRRGSMVRPVELCIATDWHFAALAFMPDHSSHWSTMFKSC